MVRGKVATGCHLKKARETTIERTIQEGSKLTLQKTMDIARTQETHTGMSSAQPQTMDEEISSHKFHQKTLTMFLKEAIAKTFSGMYRDCEHC